MEKVADRELPSYMIPTEFVSVPYFPITPGGKVDGQALDKMRLHATTLSPAPDPLRAMQSNRASRQSGEDCSRSRPSVSMTISFPWGATPCWRRMLGQIEGWFGYKLPHSALVEHPTVHGLATYLRDSSAGRWPAR